MLYIGGHYYSIYNYDELMRVLKHTLKIKANCCQIFLGRNTSTTISSKQKPQFTNKEIKDIKNFIKKNKIHLYIHGSLSINFGNPLIGKYKWMQDNLIYDMKLGSKLGASGVVVHLGSKMPERYILNKMNNKKEINKQAYKNMSLSIYEVLTKSPNNINLLIETNAGQKNKIGTTIPELKKLWNSKYLKKFQNKNLGFTIDTCHIFVAGYPIHTSKGMKQYFDEFNEKIGLKHVKLIHLNDSRGEYNSHLNRHASIGEGYLFKNNLQIIKILMKYVKKYKIDIILETCNEKKFKKEIQIIKKYI